MKDDKIIDLIRRNNYSGIGEKLYHYFPVIKKLVLKNNGTKQDAEDIYQEALIILIKKVQADNFVLTSSINTYLYSICRFLWSDALKKNGKQALVDSTEIQMSLNESEIEPYYHHENKLRQAEQAFALLGQKCKELLLLFYFKQQPLKEIAEKLGYGSEKTAKNQKYRCIEKAKDNLTHLISTKP